MIVPKSLEAQNDSIELGSNLLVYAERGDTANVLKMINSGVYIDFKNGYKATALLIACEKANLEIAKILLYNNADPNLSAYDGFTPLMFAAYQGNLDLAELLIFYQANLNTKDANGFSAINYASVMGDFVMADMLVFYGADPLQNTKEGNSNLLLSCFVDQTDLITLFNSKKLDVNQPNIYNVTPLAVSIQNSYLNQSKTLIDLEANPFFRGKNNYSPLSLAVYYNQQELIKYILEKCPITDSNRAEAIKSLQIAKMHSRQTAAQLLKSKGVRLSAKPLIGSWFMGYENQFNTDDYFQSFLLGVQDYKYNLSVALNFQTRFKEKTVLRKYSNELYWQLQEKRNSIGFEFKKKVNIGGMHGNSYGGFGALDLNIMWGKYAGLEEDIPTKILYIPKLGVYSRFNFFEINAFYAYTPYSIYSISNHRFGLGFKLHISSAKKPSKYTIPWLEAE